MNRRFDREETVHKNSFPNPEIHTFTTKYLFVYTRMLSEDVNSWNSNVERNVAFSMLANIRHYHLFVYNDKLEKLKL